MQFIPQVLFVVLAGAATWLFGKRVKEIRRTLEEPVTACLGPEKDV
jgi:hypothetical protein